METCSECQGSGKVWDYENIEYEISHGEYGYVQEEYERYCCTCDGTGTIFKGEQMLGYKIYGKPNCQGCDQAKALLEARGLGYEYVDVMKTPSAQTLFRENGFRSVPQVFYNGQHIPGGFEGLSLFLNSVEGHGS